MKLYENLRLKVKKVCAVVRYHIVESDDVFIYWPDYRKGWFLLFFALMIVPGHLLWYVLNYYSENKIWFDESYYHQRIFTTWCQIILTFVVAIIAFITRNITSFRNFMGWFIPLYFGLLLMYSAHVVGLYSPASFGGVLNILLIGFVFYKPKVIYSIMVIVSIFYFSMCYLTAIGKMPYAPLFSDLLNEGDLYSNTFWLKSMAILYLPILVTSALFFAILLSQWRRREQKIENLSQTDGLTNVYNRRYVTDYANKIKQKNEIVYAVILLDLDFFKKINDTYGHDAGDEVLRSVAKVLKASLRAHDIVGRFGGEEFVLILPHQDLEQAVDVAERCRKEIEEQQIILQDQQVLQVTASFGVAVAEDGMTMDEVSRLADQALYLSKEKGRNAVSHYLELKSDEVIKI